MSKWVEEDIPDSSKLFMRVSIKKIPPEKVLRPGMFREKEGAMSVDWDQYSTPEETRNRGRNPSENGIIALISHDVRAIEGLNVKHDPKDENRSHSGVYGVEANGDDAMKTKNRLQLFKLVEKWEIDPFT
jgi:hypothetical protein